MQQGGLLGLFCESKYYYAGVREGLPQWLGENESLHSCSLFLSSTFLFPPIFPATLPAIKHDSRPAPSPFLPALPSFWSGLPSKVTTKTTSIVLKGF